jgi:hypothetical protein
MAHDEGFQANTCSGFQNEENTTRKITRHLIFVFFFLDLQTLTGREYKLEIN